MALGQEWLQKLGEQYCQTEEGKVARSYLHKTWFFPSFQGTLIHQKTLGCFILLVTLIN